jgi:hypothetical protein
MSVRNSPDTAPSPTGLHHCSGDEYNTQRLKALNHATCTTWTAQAHVGEAGTTNLAVEECLRARRSLQWRGALPAPLRQVAQLIASKARNEGR